MLSSTMEGPWNLLAPLEVKPLKEIMKQQKGETKMMAPMLQETLTFGEEEMEFYEQLHQETKVSSVAMATIGEDSLHPPLEYFEDQSNILLLLQESCFLFEEKEVQQPEEEREDQEQQHQETQAFSLDIDDYDVFFYHPLEHVKDQSDVLMQESSFDYFGEGRVQKQKDQEEEMEQFIPPPRLLSFLESDNSFLTPWRWIPEQ
ncbi:hypothetical protein Lal_00048453 [Lupinus albus]|uniref:Uncharacterized protein n=1 Tax=Lupinus albus TaxID=3870 RepID=A0A6A5M3B9_LUPAL|nr:hypothetical protein Lalb_Chr04g0250631 [Lupinus albus]KAF1869171.1 hypothetical protein Lal_00048453 [Lupinus albus]